MNHLQKILPFAAILCLGASSLDTFAQKRRALPRANVPKVSVPVSSNALKPITFDERILTNGLRVISLQDKSTPTVAIAVYYRVGSKDDPQGRSGFAHMFEHMMFKSTKNMKDEMFDRLTEDVGGNNNASTDNDYTNYFENVPSNYLETLLWAEADRMANLNVGEKVFASERDVVKEEFRQSILANPYGMLFGQYIEQLSFTTHSYKRPTIGNLDELQAATIENAQSFYKTYYRPDNATLIVVGDFDQTNLNNWVDKYFGKIARPSGEITRDSITEPERTEEKRFEKTAPNVPLPAVVINYLAPEAANSDAAALRVAEVILGGGESSRLYQTLVYQQQIATEAGLNADIRADKGLLNFLAIASEGKSLKQIEEAILAEIKKIQTTPPTEREVQKAKNSLLTRTLQRRETNLGKATAIGRAVIFYNTANAVNTELEDIQRVTPADVQRVLQKYIRDNNRVVIYYQNQGESK